MIEKVAAWLEGEGSFGLYSYKYRVGPYAQVTAQTCDRDVAEYIRDNTGMCMYGPYRRQGQQDFYQLAATGQKARDLMFKVLTHMLSKRRKDQILFILNHTTEK